MTMGIHLNTLKGFFQMELYICLKIYQYKKSTKYARVKTMRKGPIRCVRTPLHESFDLDMKRIREERGKLIQKMSDKCMTASDFKRDTENR